MTRNAVDTGADVRLPTPAELRAAIVAGCARLDQVAAACGDAFPLYMTTPSNVWTTSPGGSWSGGFWAASWWRRARLTGAAACRARAAAVTARLADKLGIDSINRCMVFWYGAAHGALACGGGTEYALARDAARAIAASFDPSLRCIPLGTDMGGGPKGRISTSVDTLAALVALLTFDGVSPECVEVARTHVDTLIDVCATPDGAWHPGATFGPSGWRAHVEAGAWSRGQAWVMLGLAVAAERWGDPYRDAASRACDYWLRTRPGVRPLDRLDRPDQLPDPSAALIAATAMLMLARATPGPSRWAREASLRIGALLRGADYVLVTGGAASFRGACYPVARDTLALVEAPWSSFLLLDAACELAALLRAEPAGSALTIPQEEPIR